MQNEINFLLADAKGRNIFILGSERKKSFYRRMQKEETILLEEAKGRRKFG